MPTARRARVMGGRRVGGAAKIFDDPPTASLEEMFAARLAEAAGTSVALAGAFAEFAGKVPEDRRPIDLDRFPFQREWYDHRGEADREMVIVKATQVGASAWLLRWVLRHADGGRTAVFVQPKDRYLGAFVRMRIKPVIRASAYLRSRTQSDAIDNVELKQVGAGWIAFRGSDSKDALDSVAADVLALDEYDTLNQANIADAEYRVTGPMSSGLIRRVGVPSLPDFGISREWDKSDQRTWMVRCQGCSEWVPMAGATTLRDNVDAATKALVCHRCRKPLDVRIGEWVAKHPDRDTRGYHAPKFVVHGISIDKILENAEKTGEEDRKVHFNKDLGEPYASDSDRLSLAALAAATRRYEMVGSYRGSHPVSMGVDVASKRALNVEIAEHLDDDTERILWAGTLDGRGQIGAFGRLAELMGHYQVSICGIDHAPEGLLSQDFCRLFAGRAYRCAYATQVQAVRLSAQDPTLLLLRRFEVFDESLDVIRRQLSLLPEDRPDDYDVHLRNVVAVQDIDKRGNAVQAWQELGPIDFLTARAYRRSAWRLFQADRLGKQIAGVHGSVAAAAGGVSDLEAHSGEVWEEAGGWSPGPPEEPWSGWD